MGTSDPTKFKDSTQTPPSPPRLTGVAAQDTVALRDWLWQFYLATVVVSGLLDPVYQQIVGEISFDQLPDPEATTIARAQATANAAWTAGEQFKFDLQNLLSRWTFGGSFTIANGNTSAALAFPFEIGNTNYHAVVTPTGGSGAPANDAFRITTITKGTGGMGVGVAGAPGGGNSVTYDYIVVTAFPDLGGVDSSEEET